jgi:hypothetical protein
VPQFGDNAFFSRAKWREIRETSLLHVQSPQELKSRSNQRARLSIGQEAAANRADGHGANSHPTGQAQGGVRAGLDEGPARPQ